MAFQKKANIAHILLAAGASTRMGRPKQLLPWQGTSLIRHAVQQILEAGMAEKIVVVTGAQNSSVTRELAGLPVEAVFNPDWEEGMGASIRCGVQHLQQAAAENWDAICISLADQPLITAQQLQGICLQWLQKEQAVVAAAYRGVYGVPACFDRSFFHQLACLKGSAGARKILQEAKDNGQAGSYELPEALFDLDTPEDYEKLKSL